MKNYSSIFNLNKPAPQTIYVSKNSAFRFSIDAIKDNVRVSPIKLYDGETEISAVGSFHGGTQFSMTVGEPCRKDYKVVADGKNFEFTIVTTDSDVAELSCDGSGATPYELPIATSAVLGGVKVNGNNMSIALDGTLSCSDTVYTLPIASDDTLGGVKISGNGLTIEEDGTLSVFEQEEQFNTWKNGEAITLGYGATATGLQNIVMGVSSEVVNGTMNIVLGAGYVDGCDNNLLLGNGHYVSGDDNILIGENINNGGTYDRTVVIGTNYTMASGNNAIAIGNFAQTNGADTIQLGSGQNTDGNTLQVRDWALMDYNGNIPQARMANILSTVTESDWSEISASAETNKIYFIIED